MELVLEIVYIFVKSFVSICKNCLKSLIIFFQCHLPLLPSFWRMEEWYLRKPLDHSTKASHWPWSASQMGVSRLHFLLTWDKQTLGSLERKDPFEFKTHVLYGEINIPFDENIAYNILLILWQVIKSIFANFVMDERTKYVSKSRNSLVWGNKV